MLERRLLQLAVLGEVVEADDLVAGLQQLFDQIAADEAGRAGDEDFHGDAIDLVEDQATFCATACFGDEPRRGSMP